MKNNYVKIYGIFLICISIINPSISFYVEWYYMPLAAVFSIPSLLIILALDLTQGICFYKIGSSSRSINKLLKASIMIGIVPNVLVTINGFVSFISVYSHVSTEESVLFPFLSNSVMTSSVMILYVVSVITFIAGLLMRHFEKKDAITPEQPEPIARNMYWLRGLFVGIALYLSCLFVSFEMHKPSGTPLDILAIVVPVIYLSPVVIFGLSIGWLWGRIKKDGKFSFFISKKRDMTTPEPIGNDCKPHTRSIITLLILLVILSVPVFILNLSGSKKDNYLPDQAENNTPSQIPANIEDNTPTKISTENDYTTVEQGACQPLSAGDQEKFDNFLRDEDVAQYDFNLPGVGIINLGSGAWRRELLAKGGDPSSYRFSQSTPHIKFMDLNRDCQYDAVVTIIYSEPVYKSEDDQYPTWVSRPLLYVFINNGGTFMPLDHVQYENGMVIDSVSGSKGAVTINMNFHIEKEGGNLMMRKVVLDILPTKILTKYDSFDDIETWTGAWESGADRLSGIKFISPPGWGTASVSSEKPPATKEEEIAEIKSGHIPLLSGISHTISFALNPSTVTVFSRDYREKPLGELPADLVQQYLTKKYIVKNQDDYLRQPTSFQCLSDDLDTKSALFRCDISYQKDKNVIVRAGAVNRDVRYSTVGR